MIGPCTTSDPPHRKPTRIEKLGELYDIAIARVGLRQKEPSPWTEGRARAHNADMQVIQTYLEQTKRPERPGNDLEARFEDHVNWAGIHSHHEQFAEIHPEGSAEIGH